MADQFLNQSNGVYTSAEDDGTGKPVTPVYLKGNSEDNPLYIKGMPGNLGRRDPKVQKATRGIKANQVRKVNKDHKARKVTKAIRLTLERKVSYMKCLRTSLLEATTSEPAVSCRITLTAK